MSHPILASQATAEPISENMESDMRLTSCRTKHEFLEWLAIKIAWMLPRDVAKWAMIRVAANATQGPWGHDHVDSIGYKEMHDRWEISRG